MAADVRCTASLTPMRARGSMLAVWPIKDSERMRRAAPSRARGPDSTRTRVSVVEGGWRSSITEPLGSGSVIQSRSVTLASSRSSSGTTSIATNRSTSTAPTMRQSVPSANPVDPSSPQTAGRTRSPMPSPFQSASCANHSTTEPRTIRTAARLMKKTIRRLSERVPLWTQRR